MINKEPRCTRDSIFVPQLLAMNPLCYQRGFDSNTVLSVAVVFPLHSTVGSCPRRCHMLSRINEYMPHTSTVYLALVLINPAAKQGKASPSPSLSPSSVMPFSQCSPNHMPRSQTQHWLSHEASVLQHRAVDSTCCTMSLPHLCVVYMLLCGSLRGSAV